MGNEAGAEHFSEFPGGVSTEDIHLPEAVLRGDKALGEDEVVKRGGVNMRDAVRVPLNGYGGGEPGDGESAVDLGKGIAQGLMGPVASPDHGCDDQDKGKRDEDDDGAEEDTAAASGEATIFKVLRRPGCGAAGEQCGLGWGWIEGVHALIESLNGGCAGLSRRQRALLCSDVLEHGNSAFVEMQRRFIIRNHEMEVGGCLPVQVFMR